MEKYKEIYSEKELTSLLHHTINEITEIVTSTMGPYGSTVILTNKFEGPYPTKDGVSIIKAIGFDNPVKNTVAQLLREVAEKTLKVAGDGTTTAICLASAIMSIGKRVINEEFSYLDAYEQLNKLEKEVLKELDLISMELVDHNIVDVATISANGNVHMGKTIEEAFSHSDNVKVEIGIESFDVIEKVNGMVLDTGYLDPALVNVPEKDAIVYDNPKIVIIDGKLNDLKSIGSFLEGNDSPVIVIADDISPNVQSIIRDNFNRGALTIGFMKTPGFGGHRTNLVTDLEFFTGAKAVSNKGVIYGTVDSIEVGRDKTTITKKEISDECKEHAKVLQELKKNRSDSHSVDLLDIRISNLLGTMSIIKVGGISSSEVNEKYDRYDDAVRAVGCALEEGVVPGGGQALLNIHTKLSKEIPDNLFLTSLLAPMNKIEKNSYYKLHIPDKDMIKEKIFDPTKVTKTAFINAMSVAKVLLNTKGLILDRTLW